jgi:hypothetical protein
MSHRNAELPQDVFGSECFDSFSALLVRTAKCTKVAKRDVKLGTVAMIAATIPLILLLAVLSSGAYAAIASSLPLH